MAKDKTHMNLVFIGHVDHGKSTTVGRLLFDSGNVPEQKLRKLKEKAKELGKAGFEFAFVMDGLKEEQERGVTIDLAHKRFETDDKDFTIIDAPGHRDFVKNMITGASQADAAVLVVAANDGVNAQTKEHVFLARTLGVDQLIVSVNKMDISGVDYKQEKFETVKKQVGKLLKSVGYKPDKVKFVPAAALKGDNIFNKTENMDWYDGKTIYQEINALEDPEKPVDLALRMPVQDSYTIKGVGNVCVGKIGTGELKSGMKVKAMPGRDGSGVTGEVKTIEMHHEEVKMAGPGDNVGVSIRGFGKKDVRRGDVIGSVDKPPKIVETFKAQIVVLNHPSVITVGYTPVVHVHTAQVACQFVKIDKKLNAKSGEVMEENPDFIKNGDAAIVTLKPTRPLVIERQKDFPPLSRFAIRDSGSTVSAGMCIDFEEKK